MRPRAIGSRPRVMAVSSGGGHWVQLLRLRPALGECDVTFVSVRAGYREDVAPSRFLVVPDANRWHKLRLARTAVCILTTLLRETPDVVLTTGAAAGFFAVCFGKLLGARTIWLDSIANVEVLSLSGRLARRFADLWLTQWPHLARANGPRYTGSVL